MVKPKVSAGRAADRQEAAKGPAKRSGPARNAAASSTPKAKPTPASAAKPKSVAASTATKPAVQAVKKADESTDWEKASSAADPVVKIALLKKFNSRFPASEHRGQAIELIVSLNTDLGNQRLADGDLTGAAAFFNAAVSSAPKPVPDKLFDEQLSKYAANLYFRGAREAALALEKKLEDKVSGSVPQLLGLASFYMSIENGAEAKRLVEMALKTDSTSAQAYETLGLASRMEFQLEESAVAYAKALELAPSSLTARRGLAEMKRSLGKSEEASALYQEILVQDEANLAARTGWVLSLFESGKRSEAEAEMAKALDANPGNIMLLAGAAYWYAANQEGTKAVDLSQKAIAIDPRFIWSHIALARGLLLQNKPVDAERTLLAARRYGNFPTLDYEIASMRLAAGFYRDAGDELAKSFSVSDGVIKAKLGGRVARESKYFTELVGYERRASIFAPTAADDQENAAKLGALLALRQVINKPNRDEAAVTNVADEFVRGDDKMRVFRQVYAASTLLQNDIALSKVVELTKAASSGADEGLDNPAAGSAVLASELYESRALAMSRDEFISVPAVPKNTLSAVLRGQIEELAGWAKFKLDEPADAVVRLRRAVSVLPTDSAWWRSSAWRLGTALLATGKEPEALDLYIRSYRGSKPDPIRYTVVEGLYKRLNGGLDGLEAKIGPNPSGAIRPDGVAQNRAGAAPVDLVSPQPTAPAASPVAIPKVIPVAAPTKQAIQEATPSVSPTPEASPTPAPAPTPEPVPSPLPTITPALEPPPTPTPTPTFTPEPMPSPSPSPSPTPAPTLTPEPTPSPMAEPLPAAVVEATPLPSPMPSPTKPPATENVKVDTELAAVKERNAVAKLDPAARTPAAPAKAIQLDSSGSLFPPVVIIIPAPERRRTKTAVIPEVVKPCKLHLSDEMLSLQSQGSDLAVIVGTDDDRDLELIKAVASAEEDLLIKREEIPGVKARALFVVRSISTRKGVFQVTFSLPCGKREMVVNVR